MKGKEEADDAATDRDAVGEETGDEAEADEGERARDAVDGVTVGVGCGCMDVVLGEGVDG